MQAITDKTIITYEHDELRCDENHNEELCCEKFCCREHFEELRDYCYSREDDCGFTVRKDCIKIEKYTGILQLSDGTYLEILPKIGGSYELKQNRQIFENLIYAHHNLTKEYKDNKETESLTRTNDKILEIFISVFCRDLKNILKCGIKKSYVNIEDNLNVYKGKLKFSEHLKYNLVSRDKFFVEYSDFCIDIAENRILKSACLYLIKLSKIDTNKKILRRFLVELDEVRECYNLDKDLEKVQINRLNEYYERPIKYAEFFLRKQNFMPKRGSSKLPALLFPLNEMFEDYVEKILKENNIACSTQYSKHYLLKDKSEKDLFKTKMDYVVFDENKTLIMDAKWKIIDSSVDKMDVAQADLYQLHTYAEIIKEKEKEKIHSNNVELALLYPKTDKFDKIVDYHFFDGTKISMIPIDVLEMENNQYLINFIKDEKKEARLCQ